MTGFIIKLNDGTKNVRDFKRRTFGFDVVLIIQWKKGDDIHAKLGKVMGIGNMMVELCSADIELRVCRYLSWNIIKYFPSVCCCIKYFSPDLQGMWRLLNDLRCLLQSTAGLLFPLSCDHLEKWKEENFGGTFWKFLGNISLYHTLARASRAASASVAMALCRWTGSRTSFLETPFIGIKYCPESLPSTQTMCQIKLWSGQLDIIVKFSHFYSLHFHSPGIRGLIQNTLHGVGDRFSLSWTVQIRKHYTNHRKADRFPTEYLRQVFSAENISQCCRR